MIFTKQEKGQTIIIMTVAMLMLVVMAALVVDGGNAYLNRRNAQTAADAAALAGAYEYCVNKGTTGAGGSVEAIITQYAVNENRASAVDSWGIVDGEIQVSVSIDDQTFFARVFSQDITTIRADASAGCFPPGAADSVLPIAWSCRPPLPGMPSDSEECDWKAIPWPVFQEILEEPGVNFTGTGGTVLYDGPGDDAASYLGGPGTGELELYLVMDTIPSSYEIPCLPDGDVNCDLDGDGRIDILGAGNRSWLILDGDANNAQLDEIVRGELEFSVSAPTWYPGREGAVADVYKDSKAFIEGSPALIPVFESFCSPTSNPLTDPLCEPLRGPDDGLVQISTAASSIYFRVIGFAEFYITCVSDKNAHPCPGKDLAVNLGIVSQSTPSIEGYFIDGWASTDMTIGTGDALVDLGLYVISLTE